MSYNFIKHNHVVEEFHMYYCSFKIKRHNITRVISWCNQATRATLYVSSIAEQQSGLVHQLQEHVQPSFDEKYPLVVLSLHERPKGQQNPLWKVSFVEMKPRYIDQIFYCTQLPCVWGVKGANPKKRSRVSWCSREVISWRSREVDVSAQTFLNGSSTRTQIHPTWIWSQNPSVKGSKLLFKVIKAINIKDKGDPQAGSFM